MLKFYSEKDVQTLVSRLREEYGRAYARKNAEIADLKEENRNLAARLSVLEAERGSVTEALTHAVEEGERIVRAGEEEAAVKSRELVMLAERARTLCERLSRKYPDEEDVLKLQAFTSTFERELGIAEEETFDMDLVLNPGELDLGDICKSLGLMEEEE